MSLPPPGGNGLDYRVTIGSRRIDASVVGNPVQALGKAGGPSRGRSKVGIGVATTQSRCAGATCCTYEFRPDDNDKTHFLRGAWRRSALDCRGRMVGWDD